ncbi:hypothetical protein HDV00_005884 [Rhizophlyctis rosea]|nr:hypothetical protein HDV00_005884 [Rhizophlyctis rosea]
MSTCDTPHCLQRLVVSRGRPIPHLLRPRRHRTLLRWHLRSPTLHQQQRHRLLCARPSSSGSKPAGYPFVVRYLSLNTTGKTLTKSKATSLHSAGLTIALKWEGSATAALSGYSHSQTDPTNAQNQLLALSTRLICPWVEFDAPKSQQTAINPYLDGVAFVIGRACTGVYGGYYVVEWSLDAGKATWGWQTYASSGGQWDLRAK